MINFNPFYQYIATYPIGMWLECLPEKILVSQRQGCHRKFCIWEKSVKSLLSIEPQNLDLLHSVSAERSDLTMHQRANISRLLHILRPWRKRPFSLYGCDIDTEWRSYLKWNRIRLYITLLKKRTVLDIGCGNSYYIWRMIGSGAKLVIGIDPVLLFLCQFEAVQKLLGNIFHAYLLPLRLEQLPSTNSFDTVFSMGVLYHCRSPLDHLFSIKKQLKGGGELILESLVISGSSQQVLSTNHKLRFYE
jgi:tRNA (mo5U34)-methyltransferase